MVSQQTSSPFMAGEANCERTRERVTRASFRVRLSRDFFNLATPLNRDLARRLQNG